MKTHLVTGIATQAACGSPSPSSRRLAANEGGPPRHSAVLDGHCQGSGLG